MAGRWHEWLGSAPGNTLEVHPALRILEFCTAAPNHPGGWRANAVFGVEVVWGVTFSEVLRYIYSKSTGWFLSSRSWSEMITASEEVSQAETQTTAEAVMIMNAQRDPAAFTPIYRKYLDQVYYYLLSRVNHPNEAEDLAAQVFLEALERLPDYREEGNFTAWLFTIARRRAADYYRRARNVEQLHEDQDNQDPDQDVMSQILNAEELHSLTELVAGLDEEERELLRLRFAAGLKFTDIASLLKRSESAVKMSLYRLLSRLKSQMEAKNA
jgi:RNA polymerase sigma-70 factor, ECF subfamily